MLFICWSYFILLILSGVSSNFAVLLNYFSLIILDFTGLETDHELKVLFRKVRSKSLQLLQTYLHIKCNSNN
ncbi:unnamed protein product [Rhizophagus irregularis]|nr:unnamed protein product [Rhizophagus irregularis]